MKYSHKVLFVIKICLVQIAGSITPVQFSGQYLFILQTILTSIKKNQSNCKHTPLPITMSICVIDVN